MTRFLRYLLKYLSCKETCFLLPLKKQSFKEESFVIILKDISFPMVNFIWHVIGRDPFNGSYTTLPPKGIIVEFSAFLHGR